MERRLARRKQKRVACSYPGNNSILAPVHEPISQYLNAKLHLIFYTLFFTLLSCDIAGAGWHSNADSSSATLSGFVKDSASGETLIGARIRVRSLGIGA